MEFVHFIVAQAPVYQQVVVELAAGQKTSHWMWFIFPQLRGLGSSQMSEKFALDSLPAATRYLRHQLLGARLRECTQLVLHANNRTAEEIFGSIDCLKFRSSMTLFSLTSPPEGLFDAALDRFFAGKKDPRTLELLRLKGM